MALHIAGISVGDTRLEFGVELVRLRAPAIEKCIESGKRALHVCRGKAHAHRRHLAGRYREHKVRADLGAGLVGVNRLTVPPDDTLLHGVLEVPAAVFTVQPRGVGFVVAEQPSGVALRIESVVA